MVLRHSDNTLSHHIAYCSYSVISGPSKKRLSRWMWVVVVTCDDVKCLFWALAPASCDSYTGQALDRTVSDDGAYLFGFWPPPNQCWIGDNRVCHSIEGPASHFRKYSTSFPMKSLTSIKRCCRFIGNGYEAWLFSRVFYLLSTHDISSLVRTQSPYLQNLSWSSSPLFFWRIGRCWTSLGLLTSSFQHAIINEVRNISPFIAPHNV